MAQADSRGRFVGGGHRVYLYWHTVRPTFVRCIKPGKIVLLRICDTLREIFGFSRGWFVD